VRVRDDDHARGFILRGGREGRGGGRGGRGGRHGPSLGSWNHTRQAHYSSAMTQTQKGLDRPRHRRGRRHRREPLRPGVGGWSGRRVPAFRRRGAQHVLLAALSERLNKRGVADAVATLDALAAADPDVAEHAHEFAHALGSKPTARPPISSKRFPPAATAFSSGCRHGVIQAYFESARAGDAARGRKPCVNRSRVRRESAGCCFNVCTGWVTA